MSGSETPPRPFRSRTLGRVLSRVERRGPTPTVSVGEVSDQLRQTGPLYLLMAAACVAVSPLSGVPFVTTACGLSIAVLSAQLLLNRRAAWMPYALRRRRIPFGRLRSGLARADRVAGAVEAVLQRRWVWLTGGPVRAGLLSICLVIGLIMPLMEVVPFAGTLLASVVLVVAMALIARDGLAALLAGATISAGLGTAAIHVV